MKGLLWGRVSAVRHTMEEDSIFQPGLGVLSWSGGALPSRLCGLLSTLSDGCRLELKQD